MAKPADAAAKGQTARSGSSIRIGFEGGQMPLIRRIPKRGFNNARHTTRYLPVNLEDLNRFDDGARVDEAALRNAGLANGRGAGIKILGGGELTRKLTVSAHAFSASAKTKIKPKAGRASSSLLARLSQHNLRLRRPKPARMRSEVNANLTNRRLRIRAANSLRASDLGLRIAIGNGYVFAYPLTFSVWSLLFEVRGPKPEGSSRLECETPIGQVSGCF